MKTSKKVLKMTNSPIIGALITRLCDMVGGVMCCPGYSRSGGSFRNGVRTSSRYDVKDGKREKRDAVGINCQEGSRSLQVSGLTSHPKAGYFILATRCEQLCNHRDYL